MYGAPQKVYFRANVDPVVQCQCKTMQQGGKDFKDAFRHDIPPFKGGYKEAQTSVRQSISALTRNATAFWIGVACGGVEGCKVQWNANYKHQHPMQWLARVYETDSEPFHSKMKAELIEFYKGRCENQIARGGGRAGPPPYSVFVAWTNDEYKEVEQVEYEVAFRHDVVPYEGRWQHCLTSVKKSISGLTQNAMRKWIGVTSDKETDGCRQRWNNKYKRYGLNNMAAVYQTKSVHHRANMETALIEFYKDDLDNVKGGGGGPAGEPPYVVYVAWEA